MSHFQPVGDLILRAHYTMLTEPLPCPTLRVRDLILRARYTMLTESLPYPTLSECTTPPEP